MDKHFATNEKLCRFDPCQEYHFLVDIAQYLVYPRQMKQKFKSLPKVIEAYQWFKVSDYIEGVKRDVDYYRRPELDGQQRCKHCDIIMHNHGWIDTLEGGHIVCPTDWIITGIKGETYPCKVDIFEKTYEAL